MPSIKFLPTQKTLAAANGETLLDAARRAGVDIPAPCNGIGVCGKCLVKIIGGTAVAARDSNEDGANCNHLAPAGFVLACQTLIGDDDLIVEIPHRQESGLQIYHGGDSVEITLRPRWRKIYHLENDHTKIYLTGENVEHGEILRGTENGDTSAKIYGAAIDIGTTTLAAAVVDLRTGEELATVSGANPQADYAQDVLGRVHFATTADGLEILRARVAHAIDALVAQAARAAAVPLDHIYEAVISGNSCMQHLALGIDPSSLGKHPYEPRNRGNCYVRAADAGLKLANEGEVYVAPVISGHVGGDIVSGIIATDLPNSSGATLFIDVGTNGEMALARDRKLLAASTAAGPAFEGMNIEQGMRAAAGAIEKFAITADGEIEIAVIGDCEAVGICGSGLLDLIAEIARVGVVDSGGRFIRDPKNLPAKLANRLEKIDGKTVFRVAEKVLLTQKDVRQVQLAKAAIRAGIDLLLAQAEASDVERVLIAGSFGYHLREKSLIDLGLVPPEFAGKIRAVGNTSLAGAKIFLWDREAKISAAKMASQVETVNLADLPDFQSRFVAAMGFATK